MLVKGATGGCGCNFKSVNFKLISAIDILRISCQVNATRHHWWLSILIQVMAGCRLATSHYLSQSWPSSMSPYGNTRPQWVNGYLRRFYWLLSTTQLHYDAQWCHLTEKLSTLVALCVEIPPFTGGYPAQRVSNSFDVSLFLASTVSNDFRWHHWMLM